MWLVQNGSFTCEEKFRKLFKQFITIIKVLEITFWTGKLCQIELNCVEFFLDHKMYCEKVKDGHFVIIISCVQMKSWAGNSVKFEFPAVSHE
jgi:hypothetical protein